MALYGRLDLIKLWRNDNDFEMSFWVFGTTEEEQEEEEEKS